jgi:hypothetical protein
MTVVGQELRCVREVFIKKVNGCRGWITIVIVGELKERHSSFIWKFEEQSEREKMLVSQHTIAAAHNTQSTIGMRMRILMGDLRHDEWRPGLRGLDIAAFQRIGHWGIIWPILKAEPSFENLAEGPLAEHRDRRATVFLPFDHRTSGRDTVCNIYRDVNGLR